MPDTSPSSSADLSAVSDEQLACRAQSGCRASFAELVRRMRPRLLHLLRRRTRSLSDAEDLAQETFLRAYRRIGDYRATWRFSTWLFTIAARLAADHHRARRVTRSLPAAYPIPDDAPPPFQTMIEEDVRDNLWAAAHRVLDDRQYLALWLRYGEQMSVREVAEVMRKSSVHVRVLLHRARCKLAPHVRSWAPNDPPPVEVKGDVPAAPSSADPRMIGGA